MNASFTRFAVKPLYLLFTFLFTTVTRKSASSADRPSNICMNKVSLFVFDIVLSPPLEINEPPANNEEEIKLLSDFMNHYQDEADRMTEKIS